MTRKKEIVRKRARAFEPDIRSKRSATPALEETGGLRCGNGGRKPPCPHRR